MTAALRGRSFVSVTDFTPSEIESVLALAAKLNNAEYHSFADLAATEPRNLALLIDGLNEEKAISIISQAQELVHEADDSGTGEGE